MKTETIAARFMSMAPALVELEHMPFGWEACLKFRGDSRRGGDHARRSTMKLTGVHLWATRQSNMGRDLALPITEDQWEDWFVRNFAITESSDLLDRFTGKTLGFESDVVLYDQDGNAQCSSQFKKPRHVQFVLGGGHLDVICDGIHYTEDA